MLYFRILDSVVMSAVIDPPPNVLIENITLVFKNAQVYTLLFRYLLFIYFLFNLIGVACLFVCLFHERGTPTVHAFHICVIMLSSSALIQTGI